MKAKPHNIVQLILSYFTSWKLHRTHWEHCFSTTDSHEVRVYYFIDIFFTLISLLFIRIYKKRDKLSKHYIMLLFKQKFKDICKFSRSFRNNSRTFQGQKPEFQNSRFQELFHFSRTFQGLCKPWVGVGSRLFY